MNVNMKMIELLTLSLFIYDTISVIYTYPLTLLVSIQFYLKSTVLKQSLKRICEVQGSNVQSFL